MRIGFVIYGSLTTLSGGYLYDAFIIDGLRERGHDVEVISLPSGTYLQKLVRGFSSNLTSQLRKGSFDVLIQDELCHPTLVRANSVLRRRSGPYLIALVHHLFSQEQRNRWINRVCSLIERRYLKSVDGFIHNSATTRDVVASLTVQSKPEVIAYPAGSRFDCQLTNEEISQRAHASGPLLLLFLGSIISRKGLLPLLQVLSTLDKRYWQLTVVGSPDVESQYSRSVRSYITQAGLEDSVALLGTLVDDELAKVLRTHQLFCMPYAYEGFGIAMLEAMSFGQPPLASSMGAAKETVRPGANGFLIEPKQEKAVRDLLAELYHDRAKLTQLSICARATYESSPGWQEAAEKIDHFLIDLVNNGAWSREGDTGVGVG